MKKKCFIVRSVYYDSDFVEHTKTIACFLSEKLMKDNRFRWKYDFDKIDSRNTDSKEALQELCKALRELYLYGYEINFLESLIPDEEIQS